jgi:hypothetical protein
MAGEGVQQADVLLGGIADFPVELAHRHVPEQPAVLDLGQLARPRPCGAGREPLADPSYTSWMSRKNGSRPMGRRARPTRRPGARRAAAVPRARRYFTAGSIQRQAVAANTRSKTASSRVYSGNHDIGQPGRTGCWIAQDRTRGFRLPVLAGPGLLAATPPAGTRTRVPPAAEADCKSTRSGMAGVRWTGINPRSRAVSVAEDHGGP